MNAGYSKRTLSEKLGFKPTMKTFIIGAPKNYLHTIKTPGTSDTLDTSDTPHSLDFIHLFTKEKKLLEQELPRLKKLLSYTGMLWISWPKGTSGVKTDLTENIIRDLAIKNGLVDVKVIAVDEIWSGLKLVYRLKDRK